MSLKRIAKLPRGSSVFGLHTPRASAASLAEIRRRALAVELERRGLALRNKVNPGFTRNASSDHDRTEERFRPYKFDPVGYIEKFLKWSPWKGENGEPGQIEILEAYTLALRQQHEKLDYEAGKLLENQLQYWTPGQPIQYRFRIEAGHTVGKTKLSSGMVNHFFDCFAPSIIYCFAPSREQIHDLLFKEIKSDRMNKGLPGRILDLGLDMGLDVPDHFCKGRATNDAGAHGTERIHGQHGKYLFFDLDEAEGVADFVYDAVDSMTSGGICIVLLTANPKTRVSKFYKQRTLSTVKNFRISCINHPNVVAGREIVPNAVKRTYVQEMVEKHCEAVQSPDEKFSTFTVPFGVPKDGVLYPAGTIWKPNNEFCWRVLGIAPSNTTGNTFISVGRYEAAKEREAPGEDHRIARAGVDVAGFGTDRGTFWLRHKGNVWREAIFEKLDYIEYARAISRSAHELAEQGVVSFHLRIDAGGGFGRGVISHLVHNEEFESFRNLFPDCLLLEVHFGGGAYDQGAYRNLATEMYAQADETLKVLKLVNPPERLEDDLCARTFKWVNYLGVSVKQLDDKENYRKEKGWSPDDGDGCVLCIAPDHIFEPRPEDQEQGMTFQSRVLISEV
jgi:hypothetical protein